MDYINDLQFLKDLHNFILDGIRQQGIFNLELEIHNKIINFEECPICFETYDSLYPRKKIAVVTNCLCVLCKDCLKNWFRKSYKCSKNYKFCPLCFKKVCFSTDKRIM